MRKVYLDCRVMVVVECDESMSMDDVVANLGVESIEDNLTLVQDYTFENFEVIDSK